jgi:hypothetical protein
MHIKFGPQVDVQAILGGGGDERLSSTGQQVSDLR